MSTSGTRRKHRLESVLPNGGYYVRCHFIFLNKYLYIYFWTFSAVEVCSDALGMKDGIILDSQLTASSIHSTPYAAYKARLDNDGYWSVLNKNAFQWIQVDFGGTVRYVSGLITQGSARFNQFVMSYKIKYSTDDVVWQFVKDDNNQTKVRHCFIFMFFSWNILIHKKLSLP